MRHSSKFQYTAIQEGSVVMAYIRRAKPLYDALGDYFFLTKRGTGKIAATGATVTLKER